MTVNAIAKIPGPFIGGYFADIWHPKTPYLIALPLIALAAVIIQLVLVEPKKVEQILTYPTSRPAAA
jgi:hypothetical protein